MKINFYFKLLLLTAFAIVSCEKEFINEDSIEGEWIWTKSFGGIGGNTITPIMVGFTQRIMIDDYTFKEYKNDSLVSELQYDLQIRPDSLNGTNKYIVFDSGLEYAIKLNKTELILYDIMWNDGFDVYFRRKE